MKRAVSHFGYTMINRFSEVPIPRNTGDFRIMNRKVVEELRGLSESHGFLRGLVSLVGFRQGEIEYERDARLTGQGNYNRYLGSLKIGLNGLFGFLYRAAANHDVDRLPHRRAERRRHRRHVHPQALPRRGFPARHPDHHRSGAVHGRGAAAAVGVLGEYIGRIYEEVRHRPLYIVGRALNLQVRSTHGRR